MEAESPYAYSQEPATILYTEPYESRQHSQSYFCNINFNTILPSLPRSPKLSLPFEFCKQNTADIYILNNQRDATLSSRFYYSLRNYSTCFGCSLHPSSGLR
jgi:hypothetical protein